MKKIMLLLLISSQVKCSDISAYGLAHLVFKTIREAGLAAAGVVGYDFDKHFSDAIAKFFSQSSVQMGVKTGGMVWTMVQATEWGKKYYNAALGNKVEVEASHGKYLLDVYEKSKICSEFLMGQKNCSAAFKGKYEDHTSAIIQSRAASSGLSRGFWFEITQLQCAPIHVRY